ncbi:hypothetical protein MPSEU_000336100 [Mayamaea pseudoterrestris]|nr:hypothetical protein MPSEU_000336100 [Mayamaea pseudoterrestris]
MTVSFAAKLTLTSPILFPPTMASTSPAQSSPPRKLANFLYSSQSNESTSNTANESAVSFEKALILVHQRKNYIFNDDLKSSEGDFIFMEGSSGTLFDENSTETEDDSIATAETTRIEEMTILSSKHGRARRTERNILKQDLHACVKYGIKILGYPDEHTGEPRWVYYYNGIMYVTDWTSRREITSFRQPGVVPKAYTTPAMHQKHDELMRAIQLKPMMCATHTILIVDKYGSAEKARAAYRLPALEYIAEQLNGVAEGDGGIHTMSIFEMHDHGSVFCEAPLDWILFNKLRLKKPSAQPVSHTYYGYNEKQEAVDKLLKHQLRQSKGMRFEALPSLALVVLTQGRPSADYLLPDDHARTLRQLADRFGPKLAFKVVGLGGKRDDTTALSTTVRVLRMLGVYTSVQFTRQRPAARNRKRAAFKVSTRDIQSQTKLVNKACDWLALERDNMNIIFMKGVRRWCLETDPDEENDGPWDEHMFLNRQAIGFMIQQQPFGNGIECYAYKCYDIDPDRKRLGKPLVAKESISYQTADQQMTFYEEICREQLKANLFAERFNQVVSMCNLLNAADSGKKAPTISFLNCSVYKYGIADETFRALLVEEYLDGKWTKYNGNSGYVCKTRPLSKRIRLVTGTVYLDDFLHTFSHWTYVDSNEELLVCDLQGVLNEEGQTLRYRLTDPCICNRKTKQNGNKKNSGHRRTDLGMTGIGHFFRTHECNAVCRALKLDQFNGDDSSADNFVL